MALTLSGIAAITGKREHYIAAYKAGGMASTGQRKKRVSATRAKILTSDQLERVLAHVRAGKNPDRDVVVVLLSFACGLRAQEIAGLKWKRNVLNSKGEIAECIHVTEDIGKRAVEREIPVHPALKVALKRLRHRREKDTFVVYPLHHTHANSKRAGELGRGQVDANTIVQYLRRLYKDHGFVGCTSHSGRRTFITQMARQCNEVGASIVDVQKLAGHMSLQTTAAYIEPSDRQAALVRRAF